MTTGMGIKIEIKIILIATHRSDSNF